MCPYVHGFIRPPEYTETKLFITSFIPIRNGLYMHAILFLLAGNVLTSYKCS